MKTIGACAAAFTIAAAGLFVGGPARANEDFVGKTIAVVHTGGVAGTFAVYSRLLINHMPKYLPGRPAMILQFVPGGGGIVGANFLYNAAPKDGTHLLMPTPGIELTPFLYRDSAKYDLTKMVWLGNMTQAQSFVSVWHTTSVKVWQDARQHELLMGATGRGSEEFISLHQMNSVLGTKFKIITGYKGISEVDQAMEIGEVQGRGGGWTGGRGRHLFEPNPRVRIIVQIGTKRLNEPFPNGPDISNVPLLTELATNDEDRQLLALQSRVLSRALVGPPGLSPARAKILADAFDKMMVDPEFRAEAAKLNLEFINPMNAAETTAYVKWITELPDNIKERYRKLVSE
jgi:tripartite-type tricarboxylate transporter receptor subunit TctC